MKQPAFRSEPRQVDLEEYIAEKMGEPYTPSNDFDPRDEQVVYQTLATMYQPLKDVLKRAYAQASTGKGKDRHANDKPFTEQPMMEIGRMVGVGFQTGQAIKKAQEAGGMVQRGHHEAAQAELLGAINYLAGAYILIGEIAAKQEVDVGSNKSL